MNLAPCSILVSCLLFILTLYIISPPVNNTTPIFFWIPFRSLKAYGTHEKATSHNLRTTELD